MSAVRVLLVLYDEPTRQALRSMLTEASGIEVAGEAASVVEALLEADNTSPDVVLIDAEVRGVSGVEMIRLLKDRGYDWPVVALGTNLDSLEEALRAGALGYATKEFLDEELVDIIGRVTEGVFAFGPSVMGTPQGMKVALRYMTGQAGAGVAPASSPVPGGEAKGPSQDVTGLLKAPLRDRVWQRLEEFWEAGIRGADFFTSAIGPAIEIFDDYEKVPQPDGSEVRVSRLLDEVRALVAQFALERIVQGGVGEVDPYTRFYLLYHWAYALPEVEFDEAQKLAIAVGVEVDDLVRAGLVHSTKGKVTVLHLNRRHERSLAHHIDGVYPLVNGLHQCMLLWRRNDTEALHNHLLNEGLLERDVFWRAAQALSEVLTDGTEDKTIIQGFLHARGRLVRRGVRRTMI